MILAIDPGTEQSGWVLYDSGEVVGCGVLPNPDMLARVQAGGAGLQGGSMGVDLLAIEMVASYGMPVGREVFETVIWTGRFQQAWRDPESVRRVPRLAVKMHLCHSARAKDPNVWQALVDRFGPVGTKLNPGPLWGVKAHMRAALALAVTVDDQQRVPA